MAKDRILVVDDDTLALESLARTLSVADLSLEIYTATTAERALSLVKDKQPSAAVLDLSLTAHEGVEGGYRLIQSIASHDSHCRIIVLTGHSEAAYGVRALSLGAAHFLAKPVDIPHITALIKDCLSQAKIRKTLQQLQEEHSLDLLHSFIGSSAEAEHLRGELAYAAQTSQSVFIRGETGTGKGLCAQLIHQLSQRKHAPFIRYQPTFGSADLTNSDLFGHKKGAFTGAIDDRRGLLAEADQGTFFLDEIDELPRETQVALLGVLHDRCFRPLGNNQEIKASFRLICASNSAIEEKIETGTFRKDLYHRMAHLQLVIPPLRDRRVDIVEIAAHALMQLRNREQILIHGISGDAQQRLTGHSWPGNVRELESVVEAAAWRAQMQGREIIQESDLRFSNQHEHNTSEPRSLHEQVRRFEQQIVSDTLAKNNGEISATARALGIDRGTVRRISRAQ